VLAGREVLALPDRHARLALLDDGPRTLEGLRSVLCGHHANDCPVPDGEFTLAVNGHHAAYPWSSGDGVDDLTQRRTGPRVSAVVQPRHPVLATVMFANNANENRRRPGSGVSDDI